MSLAGGVNPSSFNRGHLKTSEACLNLTSQSIGLTAAVFGGETQVAFTHCHYLRGLWMHMSLRSAFSTFNKPLIWASKSPRDRVDSDLIGPGWGQKFCISNWPPGDAHVSLWTTPGTARLDQWFSNVSPHQNHQGNLRTTECWAQEFLIQQFWGGAWECAPLTNSQVTRAAGSRIILRATDLDLKRVFWPFLTANQFFKKPNTFYIYNSIYSNTYPK